MIPCAALLSATGPPAESIPAARNPRAVIILTDCCSKHISRDAGTDEQEVVLEQTEVNAEKPVLDSYGGHLVFSSGEVAFSSLDLLRR